jgi:hypothetical protein
LCTRVQLPASGEMSPPGTLIHLMSSRASRSTSWVMLARSRHLIPRNSLDPIPEDVASLVPAHFILQGDVGSGEKRCFESPRRPSAERIRGRIGRDIVSEAAPEVTTPPRAL